MSGEVSTLSGSTEGGDVDGTGKAVRFNRLAGIYFDERLQTLLVCDLLNHKVKRVSLEGTTHTIHFIPVSRFYILLSLYYDFVLTIDVGDVSTLCRIQHPQFVVVANNIILVSTAGGKIFRVTEAGKLILFLLSSFLSLAPPLISTSILLTLLCSGEVSVLQQHEEGGKRQAYRFINPSGMALDETSNTCYVADYGDHVIKKISF